MDNGYLLAQHAHAAACGDHRNIADRSGSEVMNDIVLGKRFARFVVLNVVVRENAREFSGVGCDERAVAIDEEPEYFLFVVLHVALHKESPWKGKVFFRGGAHGPVQVVPETMLKNCYFHAENSHASH
jgi:hypothetical protein